MLSNSDHEPKAPNGPSAHYGVGGHETETVGGERAKVDTNRLHSPPKAEDSRRRSMFDWSNADATGEGTPRRKSFLDTLSVDPFQMGENLGFQWTPSIRLHPTKSGSITSKRGETASASQPQDHSHLTRPEHGSEFSRPPTRLANDDETVDQQQRENSNLIYFNDGRRRIDYVLVYDQGGARPKPNDGSSMKRRNRSNGEKLRLRQFFQDNLRRDGLQLEEDILTRPSGGNNENTIFVKVHGTWAALCRQAEILKMKMPLRLRDTFTDRKSIDGASQQRQSISRRFCRFAALVWKKLLRGRLSAEEEIKMSDFEDGAYDAYSFVTWPFQCNKIDKYAIVDQDTFFSPTQRMEMVWEILQNARNDPDDEKKRGVEKLLDAGIYDSAYPLHDGPGSVRRTSSPSQWCERQRLRRTWASWRCLFKIQPIDEIRKYYGEKVGFYFAFLGFYTNMLAIPGLIGLGTFFYGIGYSADDELVKDVCDGTKAPGNYTMCPICRPPNCESSKLSEACSNTQWDYRMDNEATLFMAAVTVIWATVFMKAWKRREARLAYEWDTYEVQQADGVIRPDYEERAVSTRRNPVTRESEPYVPWATRSWWMIWSACITLFMLCAVGAALACLVLARVALYGAFRNFGIRHSTEWARWFVHGLIFIVVILFDTVYSSLGRKATTLECPRTQAQWLSSFLWKLFIFELLNDFVPIAYAAWFKGMSIKTPLDLTWTSELCDSGGCMGEVTELIAVLLLARLVVGNGIEIGVPFLKHIFVRYVSRRKTPTRASTVQDGDGESGRVGQPKCQWRSDNLLIELELDGVADEYMEMIVQFAFVTLFVPAFPVAPMVCLLNNILEIRVDAIKFIVSHRRPLPIRVAGIELWNEFLNIVSKLAVLCNGALMSFTSGMIPRLYYKYVEHNGIDYNGFVEHSLTYLPTIAWYNQNATDAYHEFANNSVTQCYYQHHRSHDEEDGFKLTETWWRITCVRLAAFCVFIAVAYTFQWLYDFIVPDVPADIKLKMERRRYVVSKAMEAEMLSEKWFRSPGPPDNVNPADPESDVGHASSTQANGVGTESQSPAPIDSGDGVRMPIPTVKSEEVCEVEPRRSPKVQNGHRPHRAHAPEVTVREAGPHRTSSIKTADTILS